MVQERPKQDGGNVREGYLAALFVAEVVGGRREENHAMAGFKHQARVSALGQWRQKRRLSFGEMELAQRKDTKKNLRKKKQVKNQQLLGMLFFKTAA